MSSIAPIPPSIAGKWEPVRAELDTEPVPELVVRKTQVELSDSLYAVYFDGQVADQGHYVLSATERHPMITLHGTESPNAGRTIPAIYQVAGDRLRICYGLGGTVPSEFTTAVNSQRYLVTYRRAH